jgi:PIN domain nuclease of toxin-antitoxin system
MRLLPDTHVVISLVDDNLAERCPLFVPAILETGASCYVSVVSFWEIAIKTRLGKLALRVDRGDLPGLMTAYRINILTMKAEHAVHDLSPEPATRDPFDRMLLAQATLDRALADHPVVFRPATVSQVQR